METLTLSIEHSKGTWFGCLVDEEDRLVKSAFGTEPKKVHNHLTSYSEERIRHSAKIVTHTLTSEMIDLFYGKPPKQFPSFNNDHISPFQSKVTQVLGRIPPGRVTTYGLIAGYLHSSPRAVGGAVASNPWPLFVPCHRVVGYDMMVGNYSMCGKLGRSGTMTKGSILGREGVTIQEEKIAKNTLWSP